MRVRLIIVIFVTIFFLNGCNQPDKKLVAGIKEGQQLYSQGNYVGAERKLGAVISAYPSLPACAEAYYLRGLVRIKEGRTILAEQDFKRALNLARRDDLKTNAHICLGSIYFDRKLWDNAYHHYRRACNNLPKVSPNEWVLYRLGLSAQKTGRWVEARKYFARLMREYPNSQAAELAHRRISYEFFTIQAGAFSKHYGARKRFEQLKANGLPARIENQVVSGKRLQVVFVGRYKKSYQAREELKKVRSIVPDARIVP